MNLQERPLPSGPKQGGPVSFISMVVAGSGAPLLIFIAVVVFLITAEWKVFTKAGRPGWAVLIPIYNIYVQCKIAGRPGWWVLLYFIPLVNIIIALLVSIGLARAFSKSDGFGVGLWLASFIFVPILAFGSAQYSEPSGVARF